MCVPQVAPQRVVATSRRVAGWKIRGLGLKHGAETPKQPNMVQQKRTICTSGRPLFQSASLFAAKASSDLLIGLSSNTRGEFVRWGDQDTGSTPVVLA